MTYWSPQRLNYVLFIQQLIDTTSPDYRDRLDSDRRVIGIDMYVWNNTEILTIQAGRDLIVWGIIDGVD